MENSVSMMTLPLIKPGMIDAMIVTMGIRELRSTCLYTTTRSASPFDRATCTKSCRRFSSMLLRMKRDRPANPP